MVRQFAKLLFILSFPTMVFAQLETTLNFNGQPTDTLKIDGLLSVIRPVTVQVPGTCVRQIPHQENVCRDVTRYRESCHNVPSSQSCSTDYETVCRPVTRTRQECSTGPSRRVCHQNPSREECSTGSSREVCVERPTREVCTERPTREVCHANPRTGAQSCTTVGGGQTCTTVGGGQSCHSVPGERTCRTVGGGESCDTIPGEQSCRTVTYQDQDCNQVPRQHCQTIPSHSECESIPYSQNVCGNETVYTSESYACMKDEVQQLAVSKKVAADIAVEIKTNNLVAQFPVLMAVKGEQAENTSFALAASVAQDPSVLVVVKSRKIEIASEDKTQITLEGTISLEMIDPKTVQATFPKSFGDISLSKKTSKLMAQINGSIAEKGSVDLLIMNGRKQIAVLKAQYPSERVQIVKDRRTTSIAVDLTGLITEKISVDDQLSMNVKLGAGLNVEGEILNVKKPVNEKQFSKLEAWVE